MPEKLLNIFTLLYCRLTCIKTIELWQ
jgi:hypothetical protein